MNDQEKKNQRKIYLRVQLLVMKILMENVEEKTMKRKKTLFQRGTACNPDNDNDKEKKTTISEGSC